MRRCGQSLLEILIAIGMIVFFATAFLGLIVASYGRIGQSKNQSTAALLGNEAMRAVASIADEDWNALDCGTSTCTFGLKKKEGTYALQETPDTTGVIPQTVFTRTITVAPVWRNTNDVMVPATTKDAIPDFDSRLVTVTVTWPNQMKRTTTTEFTSLIARSHRSSSFIIFDTKEDFLGTSVTAVMPPSFYGTTAVEELVNGEVRTGTVGSFKDPRALGPLVEITQSSTEKIVGMVREEDHLYVATSEALVVVSLDATTPVIEQRIFIEGGITALAATKEVIALGMFDGSIRLIARKENPLFTVSQEWDTLGSEPVTTLSFDETNDALFVGKRHGPDEEFLALDVSEIPVSEAPRIIRKQHLPATVTTMASDGIMVYIGTTTNELMMVGLQDSFFASHAFANERQLILSLALNGDTLFVLRAPDIDAPELSSWRIRKTVDASRVSLLPIKVLNIPSLEAGATMTFLPLQRRLALTTRKQGKEVYMVDERFVDETFTPATSGVSNGQCSFMAQDAQRLLVACTHTNGREALMTVTDEGDPLGYVPWASYTTPVTCVPETISMQQWNRMKFRTSGEGFVSLTVRAAPSAADVGGNPWLGPEAKEGSSFESDTTWQDISFLGASRCLQARAVFHASASCPLTLDHLLFTYK